MVQVAETLNILLSDVSNVKPNENVSPCVEGATGRCKNSKSRIITLEGSTRNTYNHSTPSISSSNHTRSFCTIADGTLPTSAASSSSFSTISFAKQLPLSFASWGKFFSRQMQDLLLIFRAETADDLTRLHRLLEIPMNLERTSPETFQTALRDSTKSLASNDRERLGLKHFLS